MFTTRVHWIAGLEPHRIGLMSRPRGGDQLAGEVEAWGLAGVKVVVSLLETREAKDLGLANEAALCAEHGIQLRSLPIPDHGTPVSRTDVRALIDLLEEDVKAGRALVIHCRAGIGRTGIVAACLLSRLGIPAGELFHRLSGARGLAMPDTEAQIEWVERFLADTRP